MGWYLVNSKTDYRNLRGTEQSDSKIFRDFAKKNNVSKIRFGASDREIANYIGNNGWRGRGYYTEQRFKHPLFDHMEILKIGNERRNYILASHPYYGSLIKKHIEDIVNLQIDTGYHFFVISKEYSWYYPNATLLLIAAPNHLSDIISENKGILLRVSCKSE